MEPICDSCNCVLRDQPGGGVFSTHGYCHDCWPRIEKLAKEYNEEAYLHPCPDDQGLSSWIRETYWKKWIEGPIRGVLSWEKQIQELKNDNS